MPIYAEEFKEQVVRKMMPLHSVGGFIRAYSLVGGFFGAYFVSIERLSQLFSRCSVAQDLSLYLSVFP